MFAGGTRIGFVVSFTDTKKVDCAVLALLAGLVAVHRATTMYGHKREQMHRCESQDEIMHHSAVSNCSRSTASRDRQQYITSSVLGVQQGEL